jgi:hypothetical protein
MFSLKIRPSQGPVAHIGHPSSMQLFTDAFLGFYPTFYSTDFSALPVQTNRWVGVGTKIQERIGLILPFKGTVSPD